MANLQLEVRASAAVPAGANIAGASCDPTDGGLNVHVTGGSGGGVNYALEAGGHLANVDASTAASKSDLDTLVTSVATLATQTTLAAILAKIVAAPALEGGNLATLASIVSGGKGLVTETSAAAILSALAGGPFAKESGGNLATLAAIVSGGKGLVTETSAAAILSALAGGPFAKESGGNLATLAGIVSASKAAVTSTQLPAGLGFQNMGSSLSVTYGKPLISTQTAIPTTGVLIKTGSGVAYAAMTYNGSGGSVYAMIFDATSTQANGTVPLWQGSQISTATAGSSALGGTVVGAPFTNGLWLQYSSTQNTLTALTVTTVNANVVYQ